MAVFAEAVQLVLVEAATAEEVCEDEQEDRVAAVVLAVDLTVKSRFRQVRGKRSEVAETPFCGDDDAKFGSSVGRIVSALPTTH
jgi:hypothetical protein